MKNIKKILIAGTIGIFVVTSAGCNMIAKTPEAIKNATVATVNGEKITKAQVDAQMVTYIAGYAKGWENDPTAQTKYLSDKKEARDRMVDELVITQQAKAKNAWPADKEITDAVKTQYDNDVQQYGGGDEKKLQDAITQAGYTKESFMAYLKQQITLSKASENLEKNVTIDDAKVQAEYDLNKDIKYTTTPGTIDIQRIVVGTQADAKKVVDRLHAGEDFAKVCAEVSRDTNTKATSGELGTYPVDDSQLQTKLDPIIVKTALALKINEISTEFATPTDGGWNVIRVIKKDIYPAKPFADVKVAIKATLLGALKGTTFTADLKKWKDALGTKISTNDDNL